MTLVDGRPVLSLAGLEAHDPHPAGGGDERRFNCPLDGCRDKPLDRAHQSLAVNVATGAWICHRCGGRGLLTEHWRTRPASGRERREARRQAALRSLRIPPERRPGTAPSAALLPQLVARCQPLAGSPGQRYLFDRGIGLGPAQRAGVTYCPDVYGRPAVVFPLRDRRGQLVALNARHTDGRTDPKTHSVGDRSLGVFATPGALEEAPRPLVITEGPCDALSLAACGVPAIALVATVAPGWLATVAAFRPVWVALDADAEGDKHAAQLMDELAPAARPVARLRPPAGKDWNDALVADYAGLRRFLAAHALTATEEDP
jgi:hypothetical protein